MAWTFASSTWTHAGTTRDVVYVGDAPNPGEVSMRCTAPGVDAHFCVRMDLDGRTCWEVAIDGLNIVIRKRVFGIVQSASASAAHGLPSGQPYTLRARFDGNTIKGAAVAADGSEVEITYDTDDRALVTAWGFGTDINGCTITLVRSSGLREQITTVSEVIWVLAGGAFYASYDGSSMVSIGTGLFTASDNVQAATLDGKVYMVGGGKAREVDIVARTWAAWTPTAGTLPGQTTSGTTTATLICTMLGSLVLAGVPETPLAIYGSASGEPDNWDIADLAPGHAWIESVGSSATNGNPITCIAEGPNNSLFIGCTSSINYMLGDPFQGSSEVITRSDTYGVSGPNAAILVGQPGGENVIAFHAPEGLMIAPLGGTPVPVSIDTLTRYMTFDHADRGTVRVTIARDPTRRLLYTFVTGGDEEVYVAYAEFIGGYVTGGRGFYPFDLPVVPTCHTIWRGRNVFGTTTGKIVAFDVDGDDLGATVTTTIPAHLLHAGPVDSDVILYRVDPILEDSSANASVRIYGGRSPQAAYEAPQLLFGPNTMGPQSWAWSVNARAPAIVLQFTSTGRFTIERVDIDADTALRSRRWDMPAAPTYSGSCKPPNVPAAPPTPDDAPDGPGPGTLPDGNTDPNDDPPTEPLQIPYPERFGSGFDWPFDAPFWDYTNTEDFGPSVGIGGFGDGIGSNTPINYWIDDGDPAPNGPTANGWTGFGYRNWDRDPARFGGIAKYDYLTPELFIPSTWIGQTPIIVEDPGWEPL